MSDDGAGARLSPAGVAVLAVAAGGAIASTYVIQPSLAQVAGDFAVSLGLIAVVASAAMLGYLVGLVFLVPLVDRISARTVVAAQLLTLSAVLVLAATTAGPAPLIGCFVLIGALATVAAQASAIVGRHSDPGSRGARMGAVSAGISAGILLSRFVGGLLSDWIGWRGALLAFAAFVAASALVAAPLLPTARSRHRGGYLAALRAVPGLLRRHPLLRRATGAGMLWFFAFNLVWVGLALRLAEPPYRLGADAIGLYSLAGVLGLVVTRVAGRLSDRFGTRAVATTGLAVAALSALALTPVLGHPLATAAALALFDAGCFAAQVANQARIVAIDPAQSGALNAAYLTLYYAAGAVGTAVAGVVVTSAGWWGVTVLSAAATVLAALLVTTRVRTR